jgi:hypothetical protein
MDRINLTQPGTFENWQEGYGYHLIPAGLRTELLGGQVPKFKFYVEQDRPFQYRLKDGTLIRLADGFPTDRGSVRPMVAQYWIAKDRFTGFYAHDSIYSTGGVWLKRPGKDSAWEWYKVGYFEANALLKAMCRNDPVPCGWWKAQIVWLGVTAGGWVGWRGNEPHGTAPTDNEKPEPFDIGSYGGGG